MSWKPSRNGLRIEVRVQPRSARDRVVGRHGAAIKVAVSAPPVGGAANAAVADLLARWLAVPRSRVAIVRGETSRNKLVEVETDDPEGLGRRIDEALATLVDTPEGRG